jgi:hypothetical protein
MNRELLRLKKLLLKANAPTREEEVSKALRVVFKHIGEEAPEVMSEEEAYKILGWI